MLPGEASVRHSELPAGAPYIGGRGLMSPPGGLGCAGPGGTPGNSSCCSAQVISTEWCELSSPSPCRGNRTQLSSLPTKLQELLFPGAIHEPLGRRPAVEGRPEGQAKVDMEEGTEEGGGQVEVPGTED